MYTTTLPSLPPSPRPIYEPIGTQPRHPLARSGSQKSTASSTLPSRPSFWSFRSFCAVSTTSRSSSASKSKKVKGLFRSLSTRTKDRLIRARPSYDDEKLRFHSGDDEKLRFDSDEDNEVETLNAKSRSASDDKGKERFFWGSMGVYCYPGTAPFMGYLF